MSTTNSYKEKLIAFAKALDIDLAEDLPERDIGFIISLGKEITRRGKTLRAFADIVIDNGKRLEEELRPWDIFSKAHIDSISEMCKKPIKGFIRDPKPLTKKDLEIEK